MSKELVSLGSNCSPAFAMKIRNLRRAAYPFDSLRSYDLVKVGDLIEKRFEGFFDVEPAQGGDARPISYRGEEPVESKRRYNRRYDLLIPHHDFIQYPEHFEAFQRRIARFLRLLDEGTPTIFVRLPFYDDEDVPVFEERIKKAFPQSNFQVALAKGVRPTLQDIREVAWDQFFQGLK